MRGVDIVGGNGSVGIESRLWSKGFLEVIPIVFPVVYCGAFCFCCKAELCGADNGLELLLLQFAFLVMRTAICPIKITVTPQRLHSQRQLSKPLEDAGATNHHHHN
jgi:hypothetical protein